VAFIDAGELKTRVQAMLKQLQLGDVASHYEVNIADSVEAGYEEIVSAFLTRGLTKAQADTWARGKEFNIDLGLFWVFTKAAALKDFPDVWIKKLDRREELKTVFLADAAGVAIEPAPADAPVMHGVIKRHPLDVFTEPCSTGRGGAGDWKRT
jgi:hypothetical protein